MVLIKIGKYYGAKAGVVLNEDFAHKLTSDGEKDKINKASTFFEDSTIISFANNYCTYLKMNRW